MLTIRLKRALNRLTSTAVGVRIAIALVAVALCGAVALAFAVLDMVDIWVLKAGLIFLAIVTWQMNVNHPMQHEAFKWRKRWLIERFGVGVEGDKGDFFVTTSYSNGIPCITFSDKYKELEVANSTVRQWNNFMGESHLEENCDMPDEKALGLTENPSKDNRPWVPVAPGLCLVPVALVERASKRPSKHK